METNLPNKHILIHFHHFHQIKTAATQVHDALLQNEDGNQYILILHLTKRARQLLDSEENHLNGLSFRFMWEDTTGLIRLTPAVCNFTTAALRGEIERFLFRINIPREEIGFGMSTTHVSTVGDKDTGKQPDECFWPLSRQPRSGQLLRWPTLVIETGVMQSLRRLREDAKKWFFNSSEQVRIVLLVCISARHRKTVIEKWQLAPSDGNQPYMAQDIEIDTASVRGAPLILDFETLLDRPRRQGELDIALNVDDLRYCTRCI